MDLETDVAESKMSCASNPIPLKSVDYLPLMSIDDFMDQVPWEECHLPASRCMAPDRRFELLHT